MTGTPESPTPFGPGVGDLPECLSAGRLSNGGAGRVVAFVVSSAAEEEDWAAGAAVAVAREWATQGVRVFLVDLALDDPRLHLALDLPNEEGITDAFCFGASVQRVAQRIEDLPLFFAPAGTVTRDTRSIFANERWELLVDGFDEAGAALLLFVSPDTPAEGSLFARVTDLVVLGEEIPESWSDGPELLAWISSDSVSEAQLGAAPLSDAIQDPAIGLTAEVGSVDEGLSTADTWEDPASGAATLDALAEGDSSVQDTTADIYGRASAPVDHAAVDDAALDDAFAKDASLEEVADAESIFGDLPTMDIASDDGPADTAVPDDYSLAGETEDGRVADASSSDPSLVGPGFDEITLEGDDVLDSRAESTSDDLPGKDTSRWGLDEARETHPSEEPLRETLDSVEPVPSESIPSEESGDGWVQPPADAAAISGAEDPLTAVGASDESAELDHLAEQARRGSRARRAPTRKKGRPSWVLLGGLAASVVFGGFYLWDSGVFAGSGAGGAGGEPPPQAAVPEGSTDEPVEGAEVAPVDPGPPTSALLEYSVGLRSHDNYQDAQDLADWISERAGDLLVIVVPAESRGRTWYRTMAGPARTTAEIPALKARVQSAGFTSGASDWFDRRTGLAFLLDEFATIEEADRAIAQYESQEIPAYVLAVDYTSGPRRFRVYAGAYSYESEGEPLNVRLRNAGLSPELVQRVGNMPT